jgi:trehalose-6-phosphate synthase
MVGGAIKVMINDYHLLLVPQMVREELPDATIGFFLHIAFPSSEIFRCLPSGSLRPVMVSVGVSDAVCLPVRRELLLGMLGADLVGFQTYNFARHFRITVSRILSFETTPKGIEIDSGFVKVGVFPIGIDVQALEEKRSVGSLRRDVCNKLTNCEKARQRNGRLGGVAEREIPGDEAACR